MKITFFPTLDEAIYLHEELISRFGGRPGLRDAGLLESALFRPRSGYYQTLAEQGAALMQSLARNHCFIDGNKRMAYALTAVFLELNGFHLNASAREAESFLIKKIIAGQADIPQISAWIMKHMEKV